MKSTKFQLGDDRFYQAQKVYNSAFDNHLYTMATQGKGTQYANALIDEAMALCGSPFHKMSNRRWSVKAVAFLERFA